MLCGSDESRCDTSTATERNVVLKILHQRFAREIRFFRYHRRFGAYQLHAPST